MFKGEVDFHSRPPVFLNYYDPGTITAVIRHHHHSMWHQCVISFATYQKLEKCSKNQQKQPSYLPHSITMMPPWATAARPDCYDNLNYSAKIDHIIRIVAVLRQFAQVYRIFVSTRDHLHYHKTRVLGFRRCFLD
jgi:hypothetical protein